jgi:ATP-dependent DNA ligase
VNILTAAVVAIMVVAEVIERLWSFSTPISIWPGLATAPGDGAIIYRHACTLGCEGIVSKRLGSPYRPGRVVSWRRSKIRR